ncbi:hypothetical protein DMN91_000157 [Ooceraea biroi]|uniref:USP8 dimerisation domain-containing protein n=2 Tax=Ooceraea biroi TaxID=2015173 RepID=A0A3L8E1M9_OOCBI|nr:hypothetical protein DMN91_000157 [Ooceraea biroi]
MPNGASLGYTCVNDLVKQARVNCAGKKPRSVYQRLPTMRQKSEMAKKNGDYKTAYILLKRWLDTVKWLKKTQDHKDRKSIYSTNMTIDQINEVKNILADLRQKLEIRCEHSSRKHDAVEKMEVDRYLIIDVRQKAHYDGSKITFDKCINIPQSEIKPG